MKTTTWLGAWAILVTACGGAPATFVVQGGDPPTDAGASPTPDAGGPVDATPTRDAGGGSDAGAMDAGPDTATCAPAATGPVGNNCGFASDVGIDCSGAASACGRTTGYRCFADGGIPFDGLCEYRGAATQGGAAMSDYCCASTACVRLASDDNACSGFGRGAGYECPGSTPAPANHGCVPISGGDAGTVYCCTY